MKNIIAFTVRNTKLFLRDKAAVFFSFLSTLILVMLYFLFIARIYIDGINENVAFINEKSAGFVVYLQMMAGVLILNSMSLALGMFTGVAKDLESGKLDSFLTSPAKSHELLISYYIGGIFVSFLLNFFTWSVSISLIGIITGFWVTAATFFMGAVILTAAAFISSSFMMLLTVLAKSSTALGVINGVAGTFLGFICGIYMPYSNLGKGTEAVGSLFPFTHLTIWFKNVVLNDAFTQIGVVGEVKDVLMNQWFTANSIGFCGIDAPLWLMVLSGGVFAVVCLTISGLLLKKRVRKVK